MLHRVLDELTDSACTSTTPAEVDETKLCHPLCVCPKCRQLLKKRQHDPTAVTVYTRDADGFTALHVAARLGLADMVTLLIEQG